MKKLLILSAFLILGLILSNSAAAKNTEAGNQDKPQSSEKTQMLISPTGSETEEEESTQSGRGEGLQNRNQNALENMSEVAKQVQELLQSGVTGGIGQQVREIAQEQNRVQEQIQPEIVKAGNRSKLLKSLIGPDYKSIKTVQKAMEQNQLRIEQLQQLQSQLINQNEIAMVQATAQMLTDQNIALQNWATLEEKSGGLFGWLFKLLAK